MFRAVKTFANHLSTPWTPKPTFPKCNRIDCPCVQKLNRERVNILRSSEGYGHFEELKKDYKKCYAIYKKWHH